MRWFWLDRFEEFVQGKYAIAVKNVTVSDEPVDDYSPGRPYFPASLIIEALAQTGGLLISQLDDFKKRVVLAKIGNSKFFFQAEPGDKLRLRSNIVSLQPNGAIATGTVHVDDRLLLEAELAFAYLDDRFTGIEFFEPADFCRWLRLMKLFDVAQDEHGNPIQVPEHLLQAEQAQLSSL